MDGWIDDLDYNPCVILFTHDRDVLENSAIKLLRENKKFLP